MIPFDGDRKRVLYYYMELSKVFEVESGLLRPNDSLRDLTMVHIDDIVLPENFEDDCRDHDTEGYFSVFIFGLYHMLEDYISPELFFDDPLATEPYPDTEERWIRFVQSLSVGDFIGLLCRITHPSKLCR